MDPVGPVSLTLDLGSEKRLADLDIDWEYPAKTFSVDVSSDGIKWKQLYGTDSNVLASTSIALGSTTAKHVKVTMREARPQPRIWYPNQDRVSAPVVLSLSDYV